MNLRGTGLLNGADESLVDEGHHVGVGQRKGASHKGGKNDELQGSVSSRSCHFRTRKMNRREINKVGSTGTHPSHLDTRANTSVTPALSHSEHQTHAGAQHGEVGREASARRDAERDTQTISERKTAHVSPRRFNVP